LFLVHRDDDRTINRFANIIDNQNQLKIENVSKMLAYIENDTICRSVQLLQYFGETQKGVCGICDVCIKNKLGDVDVINTKLKIIECLKINKANSRELQDSLNINHDIIIIALQELLEENHITLNSINEYELI
jgi:ATP-dependent DNA helicase RecQ